MQSRMKTHTLTLAQALLLIQILISTHAISMMAPQSTTNSSDTPRKPEMEEILSPCDCVGAWLWVYHQKNFLGRQLEQLDKQIVQARGDHEYEAIQNQIQDLEEELNDLQYGYRNDLHDQCSSLTDNTAPGWRLQWWMDDSNWGDCEWCDFPSNIRGGDFGASLCEDFSKLVEAFRIFKQGER